MELKERPLTLAWRVSRSGNYVGFIQELPGVMSQGSTFEELVASLADAIKRMDAYLSSNIDPVIPTYLLDKYYQSAPYTLASA